jgi:class 3 adenylate cyclase
VNARKLSDDEARLIRESTESIRALARRLGVSHHSVWRVRIGITYKTVSRGTIGESSIERSDSNG